MARKEELATKSEIEEDTEEFLLERDNQGLYLGKERFLLDEEKDSQEPRFFGKKRNIILSVVVYLIILAVSGFIAYSIFKKISTALIVAGSILGVSIVIFVVYMIIGRMKKHSST